MIDLLAPFLRRQRRRLLLVVAMMPVAAVMAMLVPYLTKVAIDDYLVPAIGDKTASVYGPLLILVALGLLVVAVGYVADALYVVNLQRIGQQLIHELRQYVYRRTLRLPRWYLDDHPVGSILTRVTSDMEALGEGLASGVLGLFMDGLKTLAFLGMMFFLNWRLTLVMLLIAPILTLLVWFFQRRVRRTFFVSRQALSEATGYLQEVLNGMKLVQLFNAERQVLRTFERKNRVFYRAQNASNFYDALLFSLVEGVTTVALALLLWYAAGELLAGVLTLGVLVAFMEYIQRLFVPIREFAQQLAVLQRALAALDHIQQVCNVPLDPALTASAEMETVTESFQRLDFQDVRFRYRRNTEEVLRGISFTLRHGQSLAIVGASGSGKSTLIRLLTRAYGGYEGSIRINGRELRDIPADLLSRWIAVVHQSGFLFKQSLLFNIGLARTGLDRERIESVARYVNADRVAAKLVDGYDTVLTAGGSSLSAGEAQLIALARAVAEQTDLIVLDEATSSIDSVTEHLIQQALDRLFRDKTVIAIAHRLSTVRHADIILVMDKGQIVERGRHEALLEQGGVYAELVGELVTIASPDET